MKKTLLETFFSSKAKCSQKYLLQTIGAKFSLLAVFSLNICFIGQAIDS